MLVKKSLLHSHRRILDTSKNEKENILTHNSGLILGVIFKVSASKTVVTDSQF